MICATSSREKQETINYFLTKISDYKLTILEHQESCDDNWLKLSEDNLFYFALFQQEYGSFKLIKFNSYTQKKFAPLIMFRKTQWEKFRVEFAQEKLMIVTDFKIYYFSYNNQDDFIQKLRELLNKDV